MKATIWHNPSCGTSRKTLAILSETPDVTVEVIPYLTTPYSREKLIQLFRDAGLTPREALRVRGSRADELGLTADDIADETVLAAMVRDPALVNRPFVETTRGVRLCRPQDIVREIL